MLCVDAPLRFINRATNSRAVLVAALWLVVGCRIPDWYAKGAVPYAANMKLYW